MGDGRDVLVVDGDFTILDIGEAEEEFGEGGFAGTGATNKTDAFTWLNIEGEVMEDGVFIFGVSESDLIDFDMALFDFEYWGFWLVGDGLSRVENESHLMSITEGAVELAEDVVDNPELTANLERICSYENKCADTNTKPETAVNKEDNDKNGDSGDDDTEKEVADSGDAEEAIVCIE